MARRIIVLAAIVSVTVLSVAIAGTLYKVRRMSSPEALHGGVADPVTGLVYWRGVDAIVVQDGATGDYVGRVPVSSPSSMTLDPVNGRAFVLSRGELGLRVIDTSSLEIIAEILGEYWIDEIDMSTAAGHVYARDEKADRRNVIYVVDSNSFELLDTVHLGPDQIIATKLDMVHDRLFVLSRNSEWIASIKVLTGPGAPVISTDLIGSVQGMDVNHKTGVAYMAGRSYGPGHYPGADCLVQAVDGETASLIDSSLVPFERPTFCASITVNPINSDLLLETVEQSFYYYPNVRGLARVDGSTGNLTQSQIKTSGRMVSFDPLREQVSFARVSYNNVVGLTVIDTHSLNPIESIPFIDPRRYAGSVHDIAFDPAANRFIASYKAALWYQSPRRERSSIADGPGPRKVSPASETLKSEPPGRNVK